MNLSIHFHKKKNQLGFGAVGIAVVLNIVVFASALINLSISQRNQQSAKKESKNLQLEEMNKNAFTVFNKLLTEGMMAKNTSGRWEPIVNSPNPLWTPMEASRSTPNVGQMKVNFCPPNIQPNPHTQTLSNCPTQSSLVTVTDELPDGSLKLNLTAENGKQRSQLTLLAQWSPLSTQCVESTDNSLKTFSSIWGLGQGRGTLIYQANEIIRADKLPYPEFSMALNNANPWMMLRSRNGTEDLPTLKQTCNVFGYRDYVSSTCDSGHTGCNFSSPSNNTLLKYDATTQKWGAVTAGTRTNTTYLYTITCQGKKLCHSTPPPTGGWYQAFRQDCSSFCAGKGLVNAQSPDSYSALNGSGVTVTRKGSWCTSGEVIPPSANQARIDGTLNYVNGCWPNCQTGSKVDAAKSVGFRCYGTQFFSTPNSPQTRDNDPSDTTVGCYCE